MKRHLVRSSALFTLLLIATLSVCAATPQEKSASKDGVRTSMLVSTQWLADHLSDPNLVVVQVGGNANDYHAAHIPGARLLNSNKIADQQTPPGTELLPPEQLKANLEAIGISDNSRVVMYAPDWDPLATRLFFTLAYIGHADHAALLDGGMDVWLEEKRPLSSEDPKITPGTLTLHVHPEIVAKLDWLKKVVSEPSADPSVVVIDSRPGKRYRTGHLPGAQSIFWENALVSGDHPVLRSPQELRQLFTAAGVVPGKKIVSYCEVGWQASHTYFLTQYLGMDAAMYDGSYGEWNSTNQQVVRGTSPR